MEEIWKDVREEYQVSNMGRVRSIKNRSYAPLRKKKVRVLTPIVSRGYQRVCIYKNRKGRLEMVHRLVMEAFVGRSTLEVNHKNGIKTDNRLENLEYCSRSENTLHAYRTGRQLPGEGHPNAKLTEDKVKRILGFEGVKSDLARELGVSLSVVSSIYHRRSWKHISKEN